MTSQPWTATPAALAELEKQAAGLKGSVQTVTADLAQPDSFAHVTGAALIKYGRIDALVNNAGIGQASVRKRPQADPLLGDHGRAMGPLHRHQRRRADQHGARRAAAHAGGKARADRHGHHQPRHHGAGGVPALRLVQGGGGVGDGGAGGGSGRHRRDFERAGAGRSDRHAAGGRGPEPGEDAEARHHDPRRCCGCSPRRRGR